MNGRKVATEWFLGLIVLPHGKRRSCHNNYYARTKYAFHGFSARNFWWRINVGAARTNPNLYQVFIIVLQSVWFCAFASWDSQVKTFFGLIKLRKNQGKIVKCLLDSAKFYLQIRGLKNCVEALYKHDWHAIGKLMRTPFGKYILYWAYFAFVLL